MGYGGNFRGTSASSQSISERSLRERETHESTSHLYKVVGGYDGLTLRSEPESSSMLVKVDAGVTSYCAPSSNLDSWPLPVSRHSAPPSASGPCTMHALALNLAPLFSPTSHFSPMSLIAEYVSASCRAQRPRCVVSVSGQVWSFRLHGVRWAAWGRSMRSMECV